MGQLVYILGKSGTGKSFSMRNFPKDKYAVINVQGKILPFKGAGQVVMTATDNSDDIIKALKVYAKQYKSIVIDDYQYTMANEFMRRSYERGYDKFTEIGRHAWDIANTVSELPNDVIVYIMCHTDRDEEGNEKIKTIGKLLDEKICLEGMSTIVLKTNVSDGVYTFLTQNSGKDTVKSPAGMFPSYAIDNDLYYVDQKIRNYYELGEFISDEEAAEIDEMAKKVDIEPTKKKRRRGSADSTAEEEPQEEKPKRTRKSRKEQTAEEREAEREEVQARNSEAVANAGIDEADGEDAVPYENVDEPELEKVPRRKRRAEKTEEPQTEAEPEEQAEEEPQEEKPRRRRKATDETAEETETADATPTRRRRRRTE